MSEKKISKLEKLARDGAFKDQFGSEWFVKIKPAFGTDGKGIDKVIFSFVKKDTAGKEFFDVYMDIDAFDNWADEIIDGSMRTVLNAEAAAGEKYPKEYKYITGANGEKSVGFMLGRTGMPLVNASIKEEGKKAIYANVPLTYGWLKSVAKQFKRTVAPRFEELDRILMESANNYYNDMPDDESTSGAVAAAGVADEVGESKKDVSEQFVERSLIWCLDKGSVMENRGKDATVFRVVTVCVSDDEPNRIPATKKDAPDYEVVDAVFYTKSVTKAELGEDFMNYCKQASEGKKSFQTKGLNFKVGDIRDGFRQLIFTA